MKYPQSHSTQGMSSKVLVLMIAGLAASLVLSAAMVSLAIRWLAHS